MKKDKPDKPSATPSIKRKTKSASDSLSPEENETFLRHINEYLLKKQNQKKEEIEYSYEHLYNHVNEYLESFITLGYTYDGERILIQHASSARDKDAILEFLKNIFISLNKETLINDKDTDE